MRKGKTPAIIKPIAPPFCLLIAFIELVFELFILFTNFLCLFALPSLSLPSVTILKTIKSWFGACNNIFFRSCGEALAILFNI